jgi:hypothetical protein
MKKIIYTTAALLALFSPDLKAARQALPGSITDNLSCTKNLPEHALDSFKKGKRDGATVKEFKRCLQTAEAHNNAGKRGSDRYNDFAKAAEEVLKKNSEFAKHVMGE